MKLPSSPTARKRLLNRFFFSKWFWLIGGSVIAVLLFFLDPCQFSFTPRCFFKMLTGYSCPGCGFQRAAHAFLNGHIVEAARYNLFLLYAIPYLLLLIMAEFILKGERQEKWRRILESRGAIWFYLVSYFVWGVVRNVLNL